MMTASEIQQSKTHTKLQREERRESILRGAAKAFVANGYDATTLDDIAREAGISRAFLYRHFDSKKDIYLAIIEDFRNKMHHDPSSSHNTRSLKDSLGPLIALAQSEPDAFRLLFRHAMREPAFRASAEASHLLRQTVIEHELKPLLPDQEARHFAAALLRDTILSMLLTWIDNGLPQPDRMPGLIVKVIQTILSNLKEQKG
jgi:AcrR family transcriptional regulator